MKKGKELLLLDIKKLNIILDKKELLLLEKTILVLRLKNLRSFIEMLLRVM